jgi:putative membrane protein
MRVAVLAGFLIAGSRPALAHESPAHDWLAPGAFSAWDVAVLALLVATAALYLSGVRRLRRRGGTPPRRERIAFLAGWGALVVAVLPPLDALSIQLFSLHMVQHELMMLVGAPLVIAGRPMPTCLWGLPSALRAGAGRLLQPRAPGAVWRVLTAPVAAWALHGLVIWIWHAPALYDAAVADERLHAVQHAMFVGTSGLFWWGLLYGRYGRAGYGAAAFYVFTTVIHTGLLGALLTFARAPLYTAYAGPAATRGIDPLADQQLAGVIMWIPAGVILMLLGVAFFVAWIGEVERRARAVTR